MSTTIDIRAVSKHYKAFLGPGVTRAVDRVSLTINAGELFFLLGPSGCGKTTLLRMLAGFIEPTEGSVMFNGRDVTNLAPAKRNTGMVFQSYALWPHMTVEQNVAFGLSVRKVPRDEKNRRVNEALAMVRMAEYAKRRPNQLSGGQQQRVSLARALVVRPEVLLLDEPLSNLDAKLRLEMRSEIRRICKETGITTVYVTHDQKEALSMADQVAVMNMGIVAQVGGPREVYERPRSKFVADFLGEANFIEGEILHGGSASGGPALRAGASNEVVDPARPPSAEPPETVTVRTPGAELSSETIMLNAKPGTRAICSIRPEAMRIVDVDSTAPNTLRGTVADSIYLGEMAQHAVDVGGCRVKVFELHPQRPRAPGEPIALHVRPVDVVLLPA